MKKPVLRSLLVALLLQIVATAPAENVPASPSAAEKGPELAALEKKLLGAWYGPACGGDYTFKADGTFELKHFTPGNNTLTGTWSIRWDALPPTLLLSCKTSDFQKRDMTRPEYEYLGKTREAKLLELNGDAFVYRFPNDKLEWRFSRDAEEGGSTKRVD
jgi:hypothetical protein